MKNLEFEGLTIEINIHKQELQMLWVGDIHASNPGEIISPYLEECIQFALDNKMVVKSDFSKLDYMNSASIPPLIFLLREAAKHEIKTIFIYDKTRKVQSASFKALDVIARKSTYTTVLGES